MSRHVVSALPAKKALGQHFLTDSFVIDRIMQAIAPNPGDAMVEIGPGRGALTLPLLHNQHPLTAIELDRTLLPLLERSAKKIGTPLHLIHKNVLDVDFSTLREGSPLRVIGNLPYNVSSPILFHLLTFLSDIQDMHFMLQKEVVERMAASPGTKTYGRLSVMLQAQCQIHPLFTVEPESFTPAPKVFSSVVRLIPNPEARAYVSDWRCFETLVRAAFGQRRKTIRNALSSMCSPTDFAKAQIDPQQRAEALSVHTFMTLSNIVSK